MQHRTQATDGRRTTPRCWRRSCHSLPKICTSCWQPSTRWKDLLAEELSCCMLEGHASRRQMTTHVGRERLECLLVEDPSDSSVSEAGSVRFTHGNCTRWNLVTSSVLDRIWPIVSWRCVCVCVSRKAKRIRDTWMWSSRQSKVQRPTR